MNTKNIGLLLAAIYILIMGIGMYLMHHQYGFSYESPKMVIVLVWVELVLTLFALTGTAIFFSFRFIGFKKPDFSALKWMLPHALLLSVMLGSLFMGIMEKGLTAEQWNLVALSCITTLLVGISEETIFRGILLHVFARKNSIINGILISSLVFGSLHLVNVFGGNTLQMTMIQFVNTFIMGLFFALLVIKVKSILPLIIYHWLWDFSLMGVSREISELSGLIGIISTPLTLVMIIILFWNMRHGLGMKLPEFDPD